MQIVSNSISPWAGDSPQLQGNLLERRPITTPMQMLSVIVAAFARFGRRFFRSMVSVGSVGSGVFPQDKNNDDDSEADDDENDDDAKKKKKQQSENVPT